MFARRKKIADWKIQDQDARMAMAQLRRGDFVEPESQGLAEEDHPLDIGYGQTISAPTVVAFMTGQLQLTRNDRVLEVGTGSGYQTAVLARLAAEVYSIEIIEPLFLKAAARLKQLGFENVHLRLGDGGKGWPEAAPFDRIIVTCAPLAVPLELIDQLKEGGRMVIPIGPLGDQNIHLIEKQEGRVTSTAVLPVRFVPMLN